jgi:NTE family protein
MTLQSPQGYRETGRTARRAAGNRANLDPALATNVTGEASDRWRASFPEVRTWQGRDLAFVPTVFDRLDRELCRLLIYRGWWLTGATIATYHPDLAMLPTSAPSLN